LKEATIVKKSKAENEHLYRECKNHLRVEAEKAARKYELYHYEPDDLVAAAWLRGLDVKSPKFLKKRIQYNLIDFVRHDQGTRRKGYVFILTNIMDQRPDACKLGYDTDDIGTNHVSERFRHFEETCERDVELRELIEYILSVTKLTMREERYVRMVLKGFTATEIAKRSGIPRGRVSSGFMAAKKKMMKAIKENNITW